VQVAFSVDGEGHRDVGVILDAVEGNPVPVDLVRSASGAEAAALELAVLEHHRIGMWELGARVAGSLDILLGKRPPVRPVEIHQRGGRACR
jgi:hypothetical protein